MKFVQGRYSWIIKPMLMVYDICIINLLAFYMLRFDVEALYFFSYEPLNNKYILYGIYSTVFWFLTSHLLKFYGVYRYTSAFDILILILKQFLAYTIITYAFIGIFRSIDLKASQTLNYLFYTFLIIAFMKFLSYYSLKVFRSLLRGNLRNVLIVGSGESVRELEGVFFKQRNLGYNLRGIYSNSDNGTIKLSGSIQDCFSFLEIDANIDEIYCAIDELTENEVTKLIQYTEKNRINIKFIPSTEKVITKRLDTDYYNYLPVLSLPDISLNSNTNKFLKRGFDILFSLFVIILILSWLSIILFVVIKLETKGPLFYRHKRNGINYKEFECYKYRSLKTTKEEKGTYVSESDNRLTKVGKFMRKTSIDELPQFVNVFMGEMSVVGPRPHMLSYTEDYAKIIDKYNFIFRHNVKPGITGLAQVSGFRGEIKSDSDIINRIKYDIFYIENWSLLLDIKIIIDTTVNIIKGEKKAY